MAETGGLSGRLYAQFLQCGVCLGPLSDPHKLPCGHRFCRACLDQLTGPSCRPCTGSLRLLCPGCRAITAVGESGAAGLSRDMFVSAVKQLYIAATPGESTPSHTDCECSEDNIAFCDTCQAVICRQCGADTHSRHDVTELEMAGNKKRDLLNSCAHDARKDMADMQGLLECMLAYRSALGADKDRIVGEVRRLAARTRDCLASVEQAVVANIEQVVGDENRSISKYLSAVQECHENLTGVYQLSSLILDSGNTSDVVAWSGPVSQLSRIYVEEYSKSTEDLKILRNPLRLRYEHAAFDDVSDLVTGTLGRVKVNRQVNGIDRALLISSQMALPVNVGDNKVLLSPKTARKSAVSENGESSPTSVACDLQKSFSVFTVNSKFPPLLVCVAASKSGDAIAVDRNNKCVKFFRDSSMYKKIYCSDTVWNACPLANGNIAISDKTVHIFDARGKIVHVLRQQPRDSHGLATNSSGDVIVTDCSSRCVYMLTPETGTIKRIITLHDGQPFKSPQYVAVNINDDIIVSDSASHCVALFDERGRFLCQVGTAGSPGNGRGELDNPCGVCTDPEGNVLICDKNNDRVVSVSCQGDWIGAVVQGKEVIHRPQALAFSGPRSLLVAEEDGIIKQFNYQCGTE